MEMVRNDMRLIQYVEEQKLKTPTKYFHLELKMCFIQYNNIYLHIC